MERKCESLKTSEKRRFWLALHQDKPRLNLKRTIETHDFDGFAQFLPNREREPDLGESER